jgi:division protein CdvB (Snf7/Vps24/ESCRT-III family)
VRVLGGVAVGDGRGEVTDLDDLYSRITNIALALQKAQSELENRCFSSEVIRPLIEAHNHIANAADLVRDASEFAEWEDRRREAGRC